LREERGTAGPHFSLAYCGGGLLSDQNLANFTSVDDVAKALKPKK
jgi:hypothetical protein